MSGSCGCRGDVKFNTLTFVSNSSYLKKNINSWWLSCATEHHNTGAKNPALTLYFEFMGELGEFLLNRAVRLKNCGSVGLDIYIVIRKSNFLCVDEEMIPLEWKLWMLQQMNSLSRIFLSSPTLLSVMLHPRSEHLLRFFQWGFIFFPFLAANNRLWIF